MNRKVKLILSLPDRTSIVAALVAYGMEEFAQKISHVEPFDPTDDGPEVELLRGARP